MSRFPIFLFFFIFLFFAISFFIPFNGLYGQDSFEYLRYAIRLKNFIVTGENPGDYFWPIGFPLYGALFSFLFQSVSISLQVVSFLGFISCFYFANRIIERLHPEKTNGKLYLSLFLSLAPIFLRSSFVIMSDMACAGFITASFYFSLMYSDSLNLKNFLLFCFCVANALMFRYASVVILIPVIFWTGFNWLKQTKITLLILGIVIFLIVLLPHFLVRKENSTAFLNHEWLIDWSFRNFISKRFITVDGNLSYILPNGIYAVLELFHPGYFIAGVLFVYVSLKYSRFSFFEWILFFSIAVYLTFLMGMPLQNPRFFLLVIPLIVTLGFQGFNLTLYKVTINRNVLLFFVVIIQIGLFLFLSKSLFERNKQERIIFKYLNEQTTQTVLYSFDMDISLKGYGLKKTFYNLWENKYEKFEHNSLVLFNPEGFKKQWSGKNPMINWEKINSECNLKLLQTFDKGWVLYEIK